MAEELVPAGSAAVVSCPLCRWPIHLPMLVRSRGGRAVDAELAGVSKALRVHLRQHDEPDWPPRDV